MRKFKPMNGSDVMLAQEQLEQERLRREENQIKAILVIRSYARGEKWTEEDHNIVLMSLGLMESPAPLMDRPRR
jgi:hypothetical protein